MSGAGHAHSAEGDGAHRRPGALAPRGEGCDPLWPLSLVYDEDKATGANVARYSCADGASLPETVAGAPFLDEVLPSFMQIVLEDAMQRMIRTEQELEGVEFVVSHWDVKLKTCRRTE